jgi:hypothetical protein
VKAICAQSFILSLLLESLIQDIMTFNSATSILQEISRVAKEFENDEAGAREALIDYSRALISALEVPSEFLQRTFWSQVSFCQGILQSMIH